MRFTRGLKARARGVQKRVWVQGGPREKRAREKREKVAMFFSSRRREFSFNRQTVVTRVNRGACSPPNSTLYGRTYEGDAIVQYAPPLGEPARRRG